VGISEEKSKRKKKVIVFCSASVGVIEGNKGEVLN